MNRTEKLPIQIAEWEKNAREIIRVKIDRFRGVNTVDVRAWWLDEFGQLQPSKRGFMLAVKHLPRLAAALTEASKIATALDLIE
jgi:hypothetical protein